MKKPFCFYFILLCITIVFNTNLSAQVGDSCSTAISLQGLLNANDSSIIISHSNNWFEFQNDSSYIRFEFFKASAIPNLGEFYNIQILRGSCSNYSIVFDSTIIHGTNTLFFELANQPIGTYYIKIQNMDTINCPSCLTPYNLGLTLKNASYSNIPWPYPLYAQCPNIILNPSFETITGSAACQGIVGFLNNWTQINNSPDWFTFNNSCANTNIPNSSWFGTITNPPTSTIANPNNAYLGVVTALYYSGFPSPSVKERFRQFIPLLSNNKRYLVKAKVALAPGTQYTSDNMNIRICGPGWSQFGTPQISAPM